MLDPVFLFTRFDGRIGRRDFWSGLAALLAGLGAIFFLTAFLPEMARHFVHGVCYAGLAFPVAALMAKRLADRGKDIEYLWVMLGAPVAIGLFFFVLKPGSDNPLALVLSALYAAITTWTTLELGLMPGVDDSPGHATRG